MSTTITTITSAIYDSNGYFFKLILYSIYVFKLILHKLARDYNMLKNPYTLVIKYKFY